MCIPVYFGSLRRGTGYLWSPSYRGERPLWWALIALRSCKGDGGRPSEAAVQGEVSNRLKLLWSKAMVVSVEEKAHKMRQV